MIKSNKKLAVEEKVRTLAGKQLNNYVISIINAKKRSEIMSALTVFEDLKIKKKEVPQYYEV